MAYNIKDSTDYGGKDAPVWVQDGFYLPGYHNAYLSILKKSTNKQIIALSFKVSPSTFSDARSKLYQLVKTLGGWMMQKLGNQPIEINLSGYMLDMMGTLERHDFLDNYKTYIEDQKNYTSDYYNDYYTKLVIEGREYYGSVTSLVFSKQASNSPFLYQYNLSFVAFGEKRIYDASYAARDALVLEGRATDALVERNIIVSPLVNSALNTSQFKSEIIKSVTNSQINTNVGAIFGYANTKVSQEADTTEKVTKAQLNVIENNKEPKELFQEAVTNSPDADSLFQKIGISMPQSIIQDIYMLIWTLNRIETGDKEWNGTDSDTDKAWIDKSSGTRIGYMKTIQESCKNLKTNVTLYVESYYVSPITDKKVFEAADKFKKYVNTNLNLVENRMGEEISIYQNSFNEYNKYIALLSESTHRIIEMRKNIEQIYTWISMC